MSRIASILAITCALGQAACTRDFSLPQPLVNTGFISGSAVVGVPGTDETQAVGGAIASVLGTNVHDISDATGTFTLGPLPAGTYRLLLTLPGTAGSPDLQRLVDGVQVSPNNATSAIGAVEVQPSAIISGRALLSGNATGNAGITVFIPGTSLATTTGDSTLR